MTIGRLVTVVSESTMLVLGGTIALVWPNADQSLREQQ